MEQRLFMHNSIISKLLALLLIFLIPLVLLLSISIMHSRDLLIEQIEVTHRSMLANHISVLDAQLQQAQSFDRQNAFSSNDIKVLTLDSSSTSAQYAKTQVVNSFSTRLETLHLISGFFTVTYDMKEEETFLHLAPNVLELELRHEVQDYIRQLLAASGEETAQIHREWTLHTIGSRQYLLHIVRNQESIVSGAYVDLKELSEYFAVSNEQSTVALMLSPPGDSASADLILVEESKRSPLYLVETVSDRWLYQSLPFIQKNTPLVMIFLALLLVLCAFLVHRVIIRPLKQLTEDIGSVGPGDLSYRIPSRKDAKEIRLVTNAVNAMLDEIQHLKIHIYEETIKMQKAQLRNLQLQIKPHFLINSLNMIYNAIESGNEKNASRLILYITDYFRYMDKIQWNLVPLQEEIRHIQNYLDIQNLRYEGHIHCDISVDRMVEDMLIPPVMLQCFVENAIKYALRMDQTLDITIAVSSFEKDFYPYAHIRIQDSGPGFPEAHLEHLHAGRRIKDQSGSHTGISNVTQRLQMIFGDKVTWKFTNSPGATAEFTLPAIFEELPEQGSRQS